MLFIATNTLLAAIAHLAAPAAAKVHISGGEAVSFSLGGGPFNVASAGPLAAGLPFGVRFGGRKGNVSLLFPPSA